MQQNIRNVSLAVLAAIILTIGVACAGGVSQSEYDAVKQQLAAQEQKAADLQKQVAEKEAAPKTAPPIVGAIPNAPPRPAPTPTPEGFVAPPPPQPPAPEVKTLVLNVKTVTAGAGESKYNVDADKYCVDSSTFKRGMHLVWLMEGYDASSGKELQTADVSTARIKIPNGENINMRYGRHGATDDAPWFWSGAWDIPPDYPLGILDYEVEVTTNSGKRDTFKVWAAHNPARNTSNRLTIID